MNYGPGRAEKFRGLNISNCNHLISNAAIGDHLRPLYSASHCRKRLITGAHCTKQCCCSRCSSCAYCSTPSSLPTHSNWRRASDRQHWSSRAGYSPWRESRSRRGTRLWTYLSEPRVARKLSPKRRHNCNLNRLWLWMRASLISTSIIELNHINFI